MPFRPGQRVRTTIDTYGTVISRVPAGTTGTVTHPLDQWGDIGVHLDSDPPGAIRAYGDDQLALVTDAPAWLHP